MANETEARAKAKLIRAYGSLIGALIGLILIVTVGAYFYFTVRGNTGGQKKSKVQDRSTGQVAGEKLRGGNFELSDVSQVEGIGGLLIAADSNPNEILWMKIDKSGKQVGEVVPIALGVLVQDPEAIASDGTYFYVAGSQSDPAAGSGNAIVRFKFDPATQRVLEPQSVSNFREFLISNVPMLKGEGEKDGKQGGLNIEGIAWDPNSKNGRLLLGLRNPLVDGHALIIPVSLRDPKGAFSKENLQVDAAQAMKVKLNGSGIRSISYDKVANSFLIISGAPEPQKKTDFKLWDWKGDGSQPSTRQVMFNKEDKPEGVTRVSMGADSFVFIVFDTGNYARLQ
jgi:hypothetical protein